MKSKYVKAERTPIECPTKEEIFKAVRILGDQFLHVYQVLHFNDPPLTNPHGFPLSVKRKVTSVVTTVIEVSNPKYIKNGLYFYTNGQEPNEEILEKAKMLIEGEKLEKPHTLACCPFAKKVFCVCRASFECKLHGNSCHGSHD